MPAGVDYFEKIVAISLIIATVMSMTPRTKAVVSLTRPEIILLVSLEVSCCT